MGVPIKVLVTLLLSENVVTVLVLVHPYVYLVIHFIIKILITFVIFSVSVGQSLLTCILCISHHSKPLPMKLGHHDLLLPKFCGLLLGFQGYNAKSLSMMEEPR